MIGTQEIVIIVIIALIVFGPQKMPEIGRQIGQMMREFRKMSGDVQSALNFDGDDHNRYDNGYGSAYKAEPPGPLVSTPSYGETYATFPPQIGDDAAGANSDGNDVYNADHATHEASAAAAAYVERDLGRGARSYSAPDGLKADFTNRTDNNQTSDAAETTNPVNVARIGSGSGGDY